MKSSGSPSISVFFPCFNDAKTIGKLIDDAMDEIEKDNVTALSSEAELYATCDVVSLHIPATAETKNSINYALLNKMPKGHLLNLKKKNSKNHHECK